LSAEAFLAELGVPFIPIDPSGTSALNISASDENADGLEAVNWVPGTVIDQSAYRSELAGVCGILACLSIIVQRFDIEASGITIALDGESSLNQSKGDWPLSTSQPCFDMLQDIRTRIDLLPIKITWKWVEGYQDDNKHVALHWWARMNIKMDTLANEFLEDCTTMHPPREHKPQQFLYEKWALDIRGMIQSSITRDGLYVILFGPRTLAFWNKRDKCSTNLENICWEESKQAIRRLPFGLHRWRGKFLTNFSGFALTLQTLKYQDSYACPLCAAPENDRDHLSQCPDPRDTHQFKKSISALPELLQSLETSPAVLEAILTILKRYRAKQNINPQAFRVTYGLRDAIREQA